MISRTPITRTPHHYYMVTASQFTRTAGTRTPATRTPPPYPMTSNLSYIFRLFLRCLLVVNQPIVVPSVSIPDYVIKHHQSLKLQLQFPLHVLRERVGTEFLQTH